MRGFRAVMLCSFLWGACLSDLRPDVGPLAASEQDDSDVGEGEGGASNGASAGNDNGDNAGGSNSGVSDGGASNGEDAGTPGTDAGEDAGPPKPNGCNVKDSDADKDVLFATQVKPILARCGCHDPDDSDPQGVIETNLDLTSYKSLRAGGDNTGTKIVVNGNPCDSIILQKLSETPPFGERMPLNGPYLSDAERALISDWIVEGARDN